MAAQFFIKRGETVKGPFTVEKLQGLKKAKNLKADDEISQSRKGPWDRLGAVYKSILMENRGGVLVDVVFYEDDDDGYEEDYDIWTNCKYDEDLIPFDDGYEDDDDGYEDAPPNPFFLGFTWVMTFFATHSWQGILVSVIWIALMVVIAFNSDPPGDDANPITKEDWPRYWLNVTTLFPIAAIPWLLMILSGLSWRLLIGKRRRERLKEGLECIDKTVEELGEAFFFVILIPAMLILCFIGFCISASNSGPRNAPMSGFKRMFETKEERERNIKIDKLLDKALEDEDE